MMKKLLILLNTILVMFNCTAQESDTASVSTSIKIQKQQGGRTLYLQGNNELSKKELLYVLEDSPSAMEELRYYELARGVGFVTGAAGGFCIGWYWGGYIMGKRYNPTLLGVGVAGALTSILCEFAARKNLHNAINIYNNETHKPTGSNTLQLNFGFSEQGLGLNLKF